MCSTQTLFYAFLKCKVNKPLFNQSLGVFVVPFFLLSVIKYVCGAQPLFSLICCVWYIVSVVLAKICVVNSLPNLS